MGLFKCKKVRKNVQNHFLTFFPRGKKGMGIGQVFIFIMAALTFALIMIFGYKAISGFLDSGEQVEFVQFKTGLEKSVKQIYTEYGSVRIKDFNLPVKFEQVCFVDMDYPPAGINKEMDELCAEDAFACDMWEQARDKGGYGSVDANVFLKPSAGVPIKVFKISVVDLETEQSVGYYCTDIKGGQFTIMIEGKGDRTEISAAPK